MQAIQPRADRGVRVLAAGDSAGSQADCHCGARQESHFPLPYSSIRQEHCLLPVPTPRDHRKGSSALPPTLYFARSLCSNGPEPVEASMAIASSTVFHHGFGIRARNVLLRLSAAVCILQMSSPSLPAAALRVSPDGRYFVDSTTKTPFFWLGNTQWAIFRGYSIDDARTIVDNVKSKGFTVLATMLAGGPVATVPNVEGQMIWLDNDPSKPNEAYFKRVDAIISHASQKGLIVRIGMLHNSQLQYMSNGKGKAYAKWVANRYKNLPNIIWSIHGNVDNPALIAMVREMAEGIREVDNGRRLISQKPDPSPKSSGIIQNEPWLDFTQSQTWKRIELIYPMVKTDYDRSPPKPTVMDEGAYEAGTEYGFPITALLVRRQAYYSYLAGGFHT